MRKPKSKVFENRRLRKMVMLRLNNEQYERLTEAARRCGVGRAVLVREFLDRFLTTPDTVGAVKEA
jgi:predicted DNA-binding protein